MYSKTDVSIKNWLQTCAGTAMCDSGGKDGRMWQRNQKLTLKDFRQQTPKLSVSLWRDNDGGKHVCLTGTVPIFDWLRHLMCELEIDSVCRRYWKWLKDNPDWELGNNGCFTADEALVHAGLIVPEDSFHHVCNTYNGEDSLSQTIQYNSFKHKRTGDTYVCISIHQGADVRGGYTIGRLFKVDGRRNYGHPSIYLNNTPDFYLSLDNGRYSVTARDGGDVSIYDCEVGEEADMDDETLYDFLFKLLPESARHFVAKDSKREHHEAEVECHWDSDSECIFPLPE